MWAVYAISAIVVFIILGIFNKHLRSMKGHQGGFWWGFFLGIFACIYSANLSDLYMEEKIDRLRNDIYNKIDNIDNNVEKSFVKKQNLENKISEVVNTQVDDGKKECPICHFRQPKNRIICWNCGAEFKDEQNKN